MMKSSQKVEKVLAVPANEVWSIISAVTGVDEWLEPITSCRVEGSQRICGTADGEFKEDILNIDHEQMQFEYAIPIQHMLPVQNIQGKMKVSKIDTNQSKVEWSWSFDVSPADESAAKEGLSQVGMLGLTGIEDKIRKSTPV